MGEALRAVEQQLLEELGTALAAQGVTSLLIVDEGRKAALEVTDCNMRPRRVFVYLAFYWFIWGDEHEERSSCFQVADTALRLAREAAGGWPSVETLEAKGMTDVLERYGGDRAPQEAGSGGKAGSRAM